MKKVVIFGATSAIAIETAKQLLDKNCDLLLAARDSNKLSALVQDLKVRFNREVFQFAIDANDFDRHKEFFDFALRSLGEIDTLIIAHGTLPNQEAIQNNFTAIRKEFDTNAISVISIITFFTDYFIGKGSGNIAVISSVAGDRARQSNYIYGTAKGTVSLYLQGLRNRLYSKNINVLTVKPGFVDTPMTEDIPKNALFAKPESIAKGIIKAIEKKNNVVYLPFFWQFIMLIIKHIPEGIFKKLKL